MKRARRADKTRKVNLVLIEADDLLREIKDALADLQAAKRSTAEEIIEISFPEEDLRFSFEAEKKIRMDDRAKKVAGVMIREQKRRFAKADPTAKIEEEIRKDPEKAISAFRKFVEEI